MKKFLSIMISFCLLLPLCGCKGGCPKLNSMLLRREDNE